MDCLILCTLILGIVVTLAFLYLYDRYWTLMKQSQKKTKFTKEQIEEFKKACCWGEDNEH